MVRGKSHLERFAGNLPCRKYGARVVDDHVDSVLARRNGLAHPLRLRQPGEICVVCCVLGAGTGDLETLECLLTTSAVASDKDNPSTLFSKSVRRNFAYAGSRPGDDDSFALHRVCPSSWNHARRCPTVPLFNDAPAVASAARPPGALGTPSVRNRHQ